MHILIAEQDPVFATNVAASLRTAGHAVDIVANGHSANQALTGKSLDLLVINHALPDGSGMQILKRLQSTNSTLTVIMLHGGLSSAERIAALDEGADDLIATPVELPELLARIRAVVRRNQAIAGATLEYGNLSFDPIVRVARINGELTDLSSREIGVLEILLMRIGKLVSKEQMASLLCELGDEVSENAIEVYVHRLRKKLDKSKIKITTMRGLGYCLEQLPLSAGSAA